MAVADRYSQPYHSTGTGTADNPALGFTSDSQFGHTPENAAMIAAIKKDAAINGLTQWGFSLLRQLGERIDPSWLKESSKEWYNKPLVNPFVPPKEDFLKFVEPAVFATASASKNAGEAGVLSGGTLTEAIRDDRGFGGLWKKYHREQGDLEEQYKKLPKYLQPSAGTPQEVQRKSDIINATPAGAPINFEPPSYVPQNPIEALNMPGAGGTGLAGPNPNAAQDAIDLARRENAYTNDPATQAAKAQYGFNPAGMTPAQVASTNRDIENRYRATHTGAGGQAPNNLLPPYLQPGNTGLGTNPMAPGIPPPGAPAPMPFAPGINTGGGFGKTAKLLELPFYLRNFGLPNRRFSYG